MISPKETDFVGNLENRKDKIYWENVFILGQTVKVRPRATITFADIYKNRCGLPQMAMGFLVNIKNNNKKQHTHTHTNPSGLKKRHQNATWFLGLYYFNNLFL